MDQVAGRRVDRKGSVRMVPRCVRAALFCAVPGDEYGGHSPAGKMERLRTHGNRHGSPVTEVRKWLPECVCSSNSIRGCRPFGKPDFVARLSISRIRPDNAVADIFSSSTTALQGRYDRLNPAALCAGCIVIDGEGQKNDITHETGGASLIL